KNEDCRRGRRWAQARPTLSGIAAVPKLFQPRQEALRLGMGSRLAAALEFAQQFLLPLGQLDRGFNRNLDVKVAPLAGTQYRHALGLEAELPPALGAFGDRNLGASAIQGGHLDAAAQGRRHERHRPAAMQVMAVTLENWVLGH